MKKQCLIRQRDKVDLLERVKEFDSIILLLEEKTAKYKNKFVKITFEVTTFLFVE
jgi:hypothetical protein